MSPPLQRPEFFDASYASLWELLPQTLKDKIANRDISANAIIDTLGQKYHNFFSFRYTRFVQTMIEDNAGSQGENYRLDNIIDAFARDSDDQLNPSDFTPITNFLEWNIFDASNSYLDGFHDYLRGDTPFKRTSLYDDMTESLTNNKSFFAVLVLAQIPIQTCLTEYYPDNTYTEFVQSVVYAGTTVGSAIYSDPSGNDGYGIGPDASGIDPTAFNPYEYNFGNLRFGIDTLPDRITAIDMWAAATPSKWNAWTANVGGFLSFIGQVFQYHTNNNINDDADLIREFAATRTWNDIDNNEKPGFASEFSNWLAGGYDASGITQPAPAYSVAYNLNNIYNNNTYTYDGKSYNLVYDINGDKSFVITVITLLAANINVVSTDANGNPIVDASGNVVFQSVTIDQILAAFSAESAPSMFYKGYAPAQYLRKLYYHDSKITFSKLIANGNKTALNSFLLIDSDNNENYLGKDFKQVTDFDPYVLLYAENDCSILGSIFSYDLPDSTTSTLIQDITGVFPDLSQNDITQLIYNNVYMNTIYTDSSFVNGYNFVTTGNVDACGNSVTPVCLDRGQKIRLDELRTLVGYEPYQLADGSSNYLDGVGPFTLTNFVAENYSTKNGGPSMFLFDCYSIYGYNLSQIYNEVFNYYEGDITPSLVDLSESTGHYVTSVNSMLLYDSESNKFTDFDLIYYLREQDATYATSGTKDIDSIEKFFPALSYNRIRATYFDFSANNSTAFEWVDASGDQLTGHPVISIDTLTDNGDYLKFLTASDTNVTSNINNADISHSNENPSRGGYIFDILTMINGFKDASNNRYTPTDIAYYVLTLPSQPLSLTNDAGTGTNADLDSAFANSAKHNPIDLLNATGVRYPLSPYKSFTKLELNGLYATDSQSNAPGKNGSWTRLSINTFLPVASDYEFLLYGTNIGADSNYINGYGIRGILHSITAYSNYNHTDLAYLCLALEYSSNNSANVVPHDIGPYGSIVDNEDHIFMRNEIRELSFPINNGLLHAGVTSTITPSELVNISEWELNINEYDYVNDKDYALLNVTDTYDNSPIKGILNSINHYDTDNNSNVSFKNIAIAVNKIWMASDNDSNPIPVDLFDGGYYTRDEIRTLFLVNANASLYYSLTLSDLTNNFDTEDTYAFYKLAYATDAVNNNGYYASYSPPNNTMNNVLSNNGYSSDIDRAQIVRKMIYSKDYQNKTLNSGEYDINYLVQPWQLVNNFGFQGNTVRELSAINNFNVYVDYLVTNANASIDSVETILSGLYKNPDLIEYDVENENEFGHSDYQEFYYEYTLYRLNTVFGYNKDDLENNAYLTRILGVFLPLDLSPRRFAIELRLGAIDDNGNHHTEVNNSYSFSDVIDALNNLYAYSETFNFTNSDFAAHEAQNKQIYINDYPVSSPSTYLKKDKITPTTDISGNNVNNITLYHSNSSVIMWNETDWTNKFFDNYTGKELINYYGFTFNEVRDYFFSANNDVFNGNNYTFSVEKFLTHGTFMTNLLFTRDFYPNAGTPVAIGLLTTIYNSSNIFCEDFHNSVATLAELPSDNYDNTKSVITSDTPLYTTEKIMQYLYYNTPDLNVNYLPDTQIYREYGSTNSTAIKDVEYATMGTVSTDIAVDIASGNRTLMTDAFSINAMYNEVVSILYGRMVVNDFYHYYNRGNLHDFITGSYNTTSHPDIITVVDNTYGNNIDFTITIDYFTLNEFAVDNSIPLSRIASQYYGTHSIDESVYPMNSPYGNPSTTIPIPYLYGKISYTTDASGNVTVTGLNTRNPTGYELWAAGVYAENQDWSPLNIRKLYYNINVDSDYQHAIGYAAAQYITFNNLVGAVYNAYDLSNTTLVDAFKGDYSLVYAQDFKLKTDMSGAFTVLSAIQILYEGSPEYKSLSQQNYDSHSGLPLGYVYKTNDNGIDTILDENGRLYYDEIRTIIGFDGAQIKTVYSAAVIVPEADADPSRIFTTATNNYWVSGTSYDTKWMTLKYAYGFSATEIAQNSTTVIGKDLLNNPKINNNGFTALETRVGFFNNLSYYNNGNSGTSQYGSDGFTKYLVDSEFSHSDITKFAQLVNYGEISSMNAVDRLNAELIPSYDNGHELTESELSNNPNNIVFYNLFKYLRALFNLINNNEIFDTNNNDLLGYMDINNAPDAGFLGDLNNLDTGNAYTNIKYGNINSNSVTTDTVHYVQICMFIKFKIDHNDNYVKNWFYAYLKPSPISFINDYYSASDRYTFRVLYAQNLFSTSDIFGIQTVPALWNNYSGFTVKDIVEYYESVKNIDGSRKYSDSEIFSFMYPYVPLELLLAYRTYYGTEITVTSDSGQAANPEKGIYYYYNPQDTESRYEPGSRWLSVETALKGMDGLWGVSWNTDGYYYSDANSDAPSIDQVLAALSIIDGNSNTPGVYGIDPTKSVNYSYNNLDSSSNVIIEIRDAYLLTDGNHPAICGYNKNANELTVFPSTTTAVSSGAPTINQLVALLNGQNMPLGFAKLIFEPTIIIRSSRYTRAEKRGLFTANNNDGGLADAYNKLSQLVINNMDAYEGTSTITAVANEPNTAANTSLYPIYYVQDHVISDLLSLKFNIAAYYNFVGASPNPFTTYGLLTAYDTNIQGYDEDGYAINVQGQLIWHNAVDRTSIIDTFESSDVSEYKYNPAGSNENGMLPYGLDNNDNYYYAYPENISNLRDVYRIEQQSFYKADTRYGKAQSNDPNLNILIALKAIGIPATIDLKYPASAYSPFTNRNIGGDLSGNIYPYIRGTNTQYSQSNPTYNGGVRRNILNFAAYDLLSAHDHAQIDSDNLGFVFNSQDRLLWNTLTERDEIIEAFSNTSNNLLKYNPTNGTYQKDANGHYYFSYPQNLNDFGDLVGSRSTP